MASVKVPVLSEDTGLRFFELIAERLNDISPRTIDNKLLDQMISDLLECVNKRPKLASHKGYIAFVDKFSKEIGETRGLSSELEPKIVDIIAERRKALREAARIKQQRRDNINNNNTLLDQYRRELKSSIDINKI